jgi:hypothetical protein
MLNGVKLQDTQLIDANGEIYATLQDKIEKSTCGVNTQFLASAFMLDDWTPWKTCESKYNDTITAGLDLTTGEKVYQVQITCNPAGNTNFNLIKQFVISQRDLIINAKGIICM